MSPIRVAVHADDPLTRLGLIKPVEAAPQLTLITLARIQEAHVAAVSVPKLDDAALELLRNLSSPAVKLCLIIDGIWDTNYAAAAKYGVRAVLWRVDFAPEKFVRIICSVSAGWSNFPSSLPGESLSKVDRDRPVTPASRSFTASDLSPREIDVLRLAADGHDIADISRRLSYSERTVKNVFYKLMKQFNLRNRTHVVSYAIRSGLILPSSVAGPALS